MTTTPLSVQMEGQNTCTDERAAGVTVASVARPRCSNMSEELSEVEIRQPMALSLCGLHMEMEGYGSCTDVPAAVVIGAAAAPLKCNMLEIPSEELHLEMEQHDVCYDLVSDRYVVTVDTPLKRSNKLELPNKQAETQATPNTLSLGKSHILVKGCEACTGVTLLAAMPLNCTNMSTSSESLVMQIDATRLDMLVF